MMGMLMKVAAILTTVMLVILLQTRLGNDRVCRSLGKGRIRIPGLVHFNQVRYHRVRATSQP